MRKILFALTVLAGLAAPMLPASAGYCTTTCNGYGSSRTCTTWCH